MTPKQLRQLAARDRAASAKLRARADKHDKWAAEVERVADEMEAAGTDEALHKRLRSSSVNDVSMHADHRRAISKGHGGDEKFRAHIWKHGKYTLTTLAKAVGCSPAVLSLNRNQLRKAPESRAKAVEKLTGWPADGRHWPCGIATEGE